MTDVKRLMSWVFGVRCLLYLVNALPGIRFLTYGRYSNVGLRIVLVTMSLVVTGAIVCGIASWEIWTKKPTARVWAIAASLVSILDFLLGFVTTVVTSRPSWKHQLTALVVGSFGLIVFLPRGPLERPTIQSPSA
jgi:hypothetical protein